MQTLFVSDDFQIVIPQPIIKSLGLKPGQKVRIVQYHNRIELIPYSLSIQEARGFLKGLETAVDREEDGLSRE